jgi:predicted dinucleotide-binding enzyme
LPCSIIRNSPAPWKGIEVAVASRRRSSLRPLQDAIKADAIILAVPLWEHREVAKALASWEGKIVIDVTNAFGVPVDDLGGLPSSTVIARALPGARLVKAFNHLPAGVLAQDPAIAGAGG